MTQKAGSVRGSDSEQLDESERGVGTAVISQLDAGSDNWLLLQGSDQYTGDGLCYVCRRWKVAISPTSVGC